MPLYIFQPFTQKIFTGHVSFLCFSGILPGGWASSVLSYAVYQLWFLELSIIKFVLHPQKKCFNDAEILCQWALFGRVYQAISHVNIQWLCDCD